MREAPTAHGRRALACAFATASTMLALSASPAFAAQLTVDDNGADCQADFTSIQAAVTAASPGEDRKSTRLNSSHSQISYAVFCLKKKNSYQTISSQPSLHKHYRHNHH